MEASGSHRKRIRSNFPMEERTMRKSLSILAGAAALGLALTGCSAGGATPDANNANQVEVFTWWASGSEKVGLDALVKVFNEQYPDRRTRSRHTPVQS